MKPGPTLRLATSSPNPQGRGLSSAKMTAVIKMDFFMRGFASRVERKGPGFGASALKASRATAMALGLALGLAAFVQNAQSAPNLPVPPATVQAAPEPVKPRVNQFSLEKNGEGLWMAVRMQFELPDAAKDALVKGVSLFFSAEVSTLRSRWYWRDEYVVLERLYWRLNFLPLSRRWRLQQANEPWDKQGGVVTERLFDDLPSALQALQQIDRWPLRDKSIVQSNRELKLTFTFELDQYLLPRPLVLGNLTNDVWKLKIARDLNLILSEAGR